METHAHQQLKRLSVAFLREHGCFAVACEVRSPIGRYRADVAGYADTALPQQGPSLTADTDPPLPQKGNGTRPAFRRPPRTIMIECKQSRADFLRDNRDQHRLLHRREQLHRIRQAIEQQRIPREEPHLRRAGSSLFPDLDEWDFAASQLPGYRKVLRELRQLDRRIHGQTKFHMTARYALADRLYLAAPRGMIKPNEVPPGWGLLECSKRTLKQDDLNADLFGDSVLQVAVKAPPLTPRERFRQQLLRNIAVAASSYAAQSMGITT